MNAKKRINIYILVYVHVPSHYGQKVKDTSIYNLFW